MKITVTELQTTITLTGDLGEQAAALRADLADTLTAATGKIVIDISAVTSLAGDGLGLLFGAYRLTPWGVELEFRATRAFAGTLRLCFGRRGKVLGAPLSAKEIEAGACRLVLGTPALPPEVIVEVP